MSHTENARPVESSVLTYGKPRVFPLLLLTLAVAMPVSAGGWSIEIAPVFIDLYGHDQHVLIIRESDPGSNVVNESGVTLDTGSSTGYRAALQYERESWTFGIDFLFVTLGQKASERATGGPNVVAFQVADARFSSTGTGEVLYYDALEDTDVNSWTFDFYGSRALTATDSGGLDVRFGIRIADFDNDYRAVVGVEGVEGLRFDASSNYGAMVGPLIGLTGRIEHGRHQFEGYVGQSVVLGEAELTSMRREFTGPFSEEPAFVSEEVFHALQDVAIPITDVRLDWHYRLTRMFSVGLGAHASTWWDVPVPPGVIPVDGGSKALHENTLVFYGLAGMIEVRF